MKKLILLALLASAPAIAQDSYSTMNNPPDNARVAAMIANYVDSHQGQGPKGDPGDTVVGPKGDKGDKGDPGKDGVGVAGPKGDTGATGPAGASIVGPVGPAGPQGVPGPAGASIVGPKGDTGATGPAGQAAPTNVFFLANATFGETATLQINAGFRRVTVALNGCLAGDRVLLTPTAALPAGYSLADAYCLTANNLTINVYAPLIVVGGSYSITAKVTVFR